MSPKTPDGPAQALSQQTYRDGDVAVIDRVALIKGGLHVRDRRTTPANLSPIPPQLSVRL